MSQRTTSAKLTPPRLYAITPRRRLFTLLKEHARSRAMIWVEGPPGAGKTSVVASYLAEHKQRTLWYHIDPGDADLATFFHYIASAAQIAAGRKRLSLPSLTPEFLADVPGFTKRFFRDLWSKVPLPAVLVLDNYQDIAADAMLHQILPLALSEFPHGTTLIGISREEPPHHLAREQTYNLIGHINWEELRLTLEETMSLAQSAPNMNPDLCMKLHKEANGWVAGTVLLLERFKAQHTWKTPIPAETMTGIFNYFAKEVFETMTSRERDVLMRTAFLPWVTGPMAKEVSGDTEAADVLRDLYQRGLFTDRRCDTQVRYQYHDLFREFLLDRGRMHFDDQNLRGCHQVAAQVAERHGLPERAVSLYAEAQSWDDLIRCICETSQSLLSQGRHQTIQHYIGLLPKSERENQPWVLYWSGISRMVFDPLAARKDLESAYQQFESSTEDIAGLLLTCGGIIESYICGVDDMAPAIMWGDRLQHILNQNNGFPSQAVEARVLTHLQALIYAATHHSLLADLEGNIEQTLRSLDDPASRCGVAATFVTLPLWRGDFLRARQILDQLTPDVKSAKIPPVIRLCWNVMEANYAWNLTNHAQAQEHLALALSIAEEFGILVFIPMIIGISAYNALAAGDDKEGERLADLIAKGLRPDQRLAQGQHSFYRAGVSLIRNDLPTARHHASCALSITSSLCLPFMTGNCRVGLAKVLVELGELAEARDQLDAALEYARLMRSSTMEVHCLLTMAQIFFKQGDAERGKESLRQGLRIASRIDYLVLEYWWRPQVMAALLARALEADIEVEFVRSVIRRRGLRAPSPALRNWPYPVMITSLGRFDIRINGVPLRYSGKTQRKPLELLKYLCVAGTQGIHQEFVEETLWPDADGEAADQAFRTTLHRLRKLLRHDDAIQLCDGHLAFDPSLVTLDHITFEGRALTIDRADVVALEQTLALYGGHFLHGETASWIFPVRERLRARFLDLTERLGAILEERGDVHEAAQQYLQALEVEPVAEVMCRRVMMAYVRLGRRTEAIAVYQRFSHALRTKLGVPPAAETVALYNSIM